MEHMTLVLPLGHEPFSRELKVERLEAEWRRLLEAAYQLLFMIPALPVP
jgi:hypothetical protein